MKRLLILAGDHQQADYWAHQWKLRPQDWRYLSDTYQLLGMQAPLFIIVGTFFHRPDAREIVQRLAIINAVEVGPEHLAMTGKVAQPGTKLQP